MRVTYVYIWNFIFVDTCMYKVNQYGLFLQARICFFETLAACFRPFLISELYPNVYHDLAIKNYYANLCIQRISIKYNAYTFTKSEKIPQLSSYSVVRW